MPQNIYARLASRGFPVQDVSGQSGQGALSDATAPPQSVGQPNAVWGDPNQDPGYQPTGMPAPEEFQLGLTLWGLSGALNPDNTPRTNAAPVYDSTLPRGVDYIEADAAHAQEFTGVELTRPGSGDSWVGVESSMGYERELIPGNGDTLLAAVPAQLKGNAPFDGVQGFGGGGDGPGGTNADMPLTYQDSEFPGPEGQVTFVNANEVPFLVANADQFIPTDAALGVWSPPYSAPTANVSAQDTAPTDVPATGPTLSSESPAYTNSFW